MDEVVPRLTRDELIDLARKVFDPEGLSPQEVGDQLDVICMNSPDPVGAYALFIEPGGAESPEVFVDLALKLPPRDIASVPESELPLDHYFRILKLEE